jgi:hypothetical protein
MRSCASGSPTSRRLHDKGNAPLRARQKGRAAQVLKGVGGTDGTADLARLWVRVP